MNFTNLDPNERIKRLASYSDSIDVDPNVPPRRYFRSGLEMVRMANVYFDEGSLENAYVLYMKFITLFIEKMHKHPEYASVSANVKQTNNEKLREVLPKAEKLKGRLIEQYTKEYTYYLLQQKLKQQQDQEPKSDSNDSQNDSTDREHGADLNSNGKNSIDEEVHKNNTETTVENSSFSKIFIFPVILVVLIAIMVIHIYPHFIQNSNKNVEEIKQIFPNQPTETFNHFEIIIDDILSGESIHPAVFLFLYESNEQKVNNIIHHLAKYASGRLKTNKYLDVQKNEFHTDEAINDYGYLVDKYKLDIIENKVMVVKNLQNIPAQTAQVFLSFCDKISPLVERVVYIFTLKVDSIKGKEEKIAENYLKKFWKDLDIDILMPLITRVTSSVIKISS